MKRASDVTVNVDARSALITARLLQVILNKPLLFLVLSSGIPVDILMFCRLLVGPLHVNINDSIEPMERNVRATIPELEAELILMVQIDSRRPDPPFLHFRIWT